jgi:hypothetical protein
MMCHWAACQTDGGVLAWDKTAVENQQLVATTRQAR